MVMSSRPAPPPPDQVVRNKILLTPLLEVSHGVGFYCCEVDLDGVWRAMRVDADPQSGHRPDLRSAMKLADILTSVYGHVVDKIAQFNGKNFCTFFDPYDFTPAPAGEYRDYGSW